jgi:hypothetical protein
MICDTCDLQGTKECTNNLRKIESIPDKNRIVIIALKCGDFVPKTTIGTTHTLKTVNPWFTDIWNGKKNFEVRIDDRGFKVGDILRLREFEPNTFHDVENDCLIVTGDKPYSGREIRCIVEYILPAGSLPDLKYCVMGIYVTSRKPIG